MSIISAHNLGLSFGHIDIFSGITIEVPPAAKIGLVGPNGVGKTSLLRMLTGLSPPTEGTVHRARNYRVGYLQQEAVEAFSGRQHSVYSEMLTVFAPLLDLERDLQAMEERLAAGEGGDLLTRYGAVQERFEAGGGYEYDLRIDQILQGLDLQRDRDTPIDHLSGGQKTRALLGRLLLEHPDLLILDEPTNHLDVQAVEWLEGVLRTWEGSLLVCSHDRYFLDRVADRIWEMTPTHMEVYRGNYSAYLQQRQERWERREEEYEREMERLRRDEELVRRYFAWRKFEEAHGRLKRLGRELLAIEQFGLLGAKGMSWSETGLRSAREMSLEEAHERIKHIKPPVNRPPRLHLRLHSSGRSGQMVLQSEGLTVGYPDKPLFTALPLRLDRGDRVAIIGPNGCGKTTFLRTLVGQIPALAGSVEMGVGLTVGYFAQAHDALKGSISVLDEIMRHKIMSPGEARSYLAQYLFRGEDVFKPVSALSGGERARLALAILTLEGVNLLFLDEPTNHLDIPAQEVLQEGLEVFAGTLVIVSHDRYLVAELANQIWDVHGGVLTPFKGTYTEFLAARAAVTAAPTVPPKPSVERGKPASSEKEERRRARMLTALEEQIARAESALSAYSAEMERGDPDSDYAAVAASYAFTEQELARLMNEWTTLAGE